MNTVHIVGAQQVFGDEHMLLHLTDLGLGEADATVGPLRGRELAGDVRDVAVTRTEEVVRLRRPPVLRVHVQHIARA